MGFYLVDQHNSRHIEAKCPLRLFFHPEHQVGHDIPNGGIAAGHGIKVKFFPSGHMDKKPEGFLVKFQSKGIIFKDLSQQRFQPGKPLSDLLRFFRLSAGYRQRLRHFQIQQIFYKVLPRRFIDFVQILQIDLLHMGREGCIKNSVRFIVCKDTLSTIKYFSAFGKSMIQFGIDFFLSALLRLSRQIRCRAVCRHLFPDLFQLFHPIQEFPGYLFFQKRRQRIEQTGLSAAVFSRNDQMLLFILSNRDCDIL